MIPYILECIAFQLVFLVIYDFFLKRETFFQWNRAYLIGTYILSLLLPWIKIEAFKTAVPERFYVYPEYLWGINDSVSVVAYQSSGFSISWEHGLLFGGMFLAALLFGHKMLQLYRLRRKGDVQFFKDFTRIVIVESNVAFSFFRSIFLGDRIFAREHKNIIEHELVHIRQRHTHDLLFFELMRIIGWFNPLVYVYQSRVSELHEFIADAQVAKTDREEQYELLLSQVFQTQNISFINQFFNSSLIKKRIVMLSKTKSGKIWKLKYLAIIPILVGMLMYTSCEQDVIKEEGLQESIEVGDIENLSLEEEKKVFSRLLELSEQPLEWGLTLKDKNSKINFSKPLNQGSTISGPDGVPIKAHMSIESSVLSEDFNFSNYKLKGIKLSGNVDVPFSVVEEVPIFPGCEDASDPRACFQEMMQKHISKYFRYPEEAQKQGIQGRVSIMFTIDEQGNITDMRQRGPHKLLEHETARIIEKLPQMQPGKSEGKAVRVPFSIPISFKLQQAGFDTSSNNSDGKNGGIEVDTKKESAGNTSFERDLQLIQITGHNAPREEAKPSKMDLKEMKVIGSFNKEGKNYINGTVSDGLKGLPGVNISVKGTKQGTITDYNGKFNIQAQKDDIIVFQYIGFPTTTMKISGQGDFNFVRSK